MEIHERFIKLPTTGFNVLETLAGNRDKESQIICDLVEAYNKKISNNVLDLKTLETFRLILCYKYQSLIRSRNGDDPLTCQGKLYTDLRTLFIKNKEYRKTEEFSVLYDIIVLQLVLSDELMLRISFKDFWDTEGLLSNTENIDLAMRVSECFADSYNLHTYLYKSLDNVAEIEEESTRILMIIQLWMSQKEGLEWKLLASLLPKLTITFEPQKIISPLWQHILGSLKVLPPFNGNDFSHITNLEEKLGVLCVMADVCFPSEREKVKEFHYEQCLQNEFWCILNRGLISKDLQQRKQALYLIKRALEFVDIHRSHIKKRLQSLEKRAMPFVCSKAETQESSLDEVKKNFFLILEVLEEKQKHLVLPALSHLPSLAKVQTNHASCCDCFDPIWLRCIYRRIVQHDNDSVKIFGLQEILKSDLHIFFDDEFLLFFVDSLNNTFLYDYNDEDKKPQIVKVLEESFLKWEQEKVTLINSFVKALASISWGPVAIYWIIQALLAVAEQCEIVTNVWGDVELRCVEDLIQTSLMTHNLQLRTCSQVLIIRAFVAYASMPANPSSLDCIFNILYSFPGNFNLKHNSNEWFKVAKHLSKIIQPSDAVQYVTERCEKIFAVTQNLKSFALAIRLLANSELIFDVKSCPAVKALRNLFQNLVGADLRPYADKDAIMKVIEFSGHLMTRDEWGNETAGMVKIDALMTLYVDEILKIVCRSLEGKMISQYDEYLIVIRALLKRSNEAMWLHDVKKELYSIENKCVNIISNPHNYCRTQWSYAIKMLYIYRKNTLSSKWKLSNTFILPLLGYFRSEVVGNEQERNARKFPSDTPETIALLMYQCIEMPSEFWPPNVHWIENLQALVETGNVQAILPVVMMLGILLDRNPALALRDVETISSIVRVSWRSIFQLKKTPEFFDNVEGLVRLITSKEFQKLDGSKEFAFECIDQMMQEAESVPLLKQIFLVSYSDGNTVHSLKAFMSCLLHGDVPRRHQRIERAAISHGCQLSDGGPILHGITDITIRAMAIQSFFCEANKPEFQKNILNMLLEILEKNKNKRYFDNSHLHRLKQRVMQTLLILEPYLNELLRQQLYDALCDLLIAESNQPSVRLIHEWLLIRLYLKNADMRETMWKLFETAAEKRPGSIVSLASVVFHVAHSLSEQTQKEYIVKSISRLLPNCMGQQFNVRLYSQLILVKIYEMLPEDSPEAKIYKGVCESIEESLRRGNMVKNSTRVLDDFYFTIFNPILDFNLETIYYDLPRLTNVSTDELIPISVFDMLNFPNECAIHCEKRSLLRKAWPSGQSSKPTGELDECANSSIPGGLSDIQKKIIPWKTMVPFYDDLSEISKAKLLRRQTENKEAGIVVVASLIDRAPNLGGIARTCEIFGAKELVIGSLRYAEDREFQTLSVSAEKWITITEVKPHLLQNYLLEKQSEGWKLVGAEQTANSTNLLEMVFPKKTILLLGNEKDGIPANLIPLLDTCVEIPQNGVVRSLNVHVTGAICIWEYAKQHLLT